MSQSIKLGEELRHKEFFFDPKEVFLNNGSYGAIPKRVMEARHRLELETERHPDDFYRRKNPQYHARTLRALCPMIGAHATDTVMVENVTTGMDAVFKSLMLKSEDAVLVSTLTYHSVHVLVNTSDARVIKVDLIFPIESKEQILNKYEECLKNNPEIKLSIIAHITSPTSVVMPVKELAILCRKYDVISLIDGAHAFGQLPLDMEELGVDFYTGNVHKWMFTPRGTAFLWISPKYRDVIRPSIPSHFHGYQLHYDFCVRGSRDDVPYHTVPEAIQFFKELGGLPAVSAHNCGLLKDAICDLERSWKTTRLAIAPDLEAPFMKLVKLPQLKYYTRSAADGADIETKLFKKYHIQTIVVLIQGELYIRLSAHVYNSARDFERLRDALLDLMKEPRNEKQDKGYDIPIMHWDLTPLSKL